MFDTCQYVISAVRKNQFPNKDGLSEYVFLGRSNVGKSSLINAITNRKLLAYTSGKPGKTQAINFYIIDEAFYLVDVPGYGYARSGFETRANFGTYIEEYLTENQNLKIAFLLLDTKVGPTADDVLMFNYLKHLNIRTVILTTKSDKIGTTHLYRHIKAIKEKLNTNEVIVTSSLKKTGIQDIHDLIDLK